MFVYLECFELLVSLSKSVLKEGKETEQKQETSGLFNFVDQEKFSCQKTAIHVKHQAKQQP